MRRRLVLSTFALPLIACTSDAPVARSDYPVVSDSAGVRIVLNAPLDEAPACTLASTPEVRIGSLAGQAPGHDLYRVFGGAVLSDGRIVVVDQGSQQLRFFSPEGELLTTAGRAGQGPGEFTDAFLLFKLPGDTLWVGDYRPWSFEVFDGSGEWIRNVSLSPTFLNTPEGGAVLDDGRTLFAERVLPGPSDFEPRRVRLMLYDRNGQVVDTLGVFDSGRSGQTVEDPTSVHMSPWFEPQLEMAVGGTRFALGNGGSPEIRIHAVSDSLEPELMLRWEDRDRAVTRGDVEAAREATRQQFPDMDAAARARFVDPLVSENRPASDVFPAFASVEFGTDDAIWVLRYRRPDSDDAAEWVRFSADGVMECRLRLPDGVSVQEFGPDDVLLHQRDEMGTESVVLHRWGRAADGM